MNTLEPIGALVVINRGRLRGARATVEGHRPGFVAEYVLRLDIDRAGERVLAATGDFTLDPRACTDCRGTARNYPHVPSHEGRTRCWTCNGNGLAPPYPGVRYDPR